MTISRVRVAEIVLLLIGAVLVAYHVASNWGHKGTDSTFLIVGILLCLVAGFMVVFPKKG